MYVYTAVRKSVMAEQPKQKQIRLTLVITEELRRKARVKALQQGTSVSAVVREFLKKWVEGDPHVEQEEGDKGKD
jgi:predicted HicB family RNase H-like nuclease